jgi:hypothetical protein
MQISLAPPDPLPEDTKAQDLSQGHAAVHTGLGLGPCLSAVAPATHAPFLPTQELLVACPLCLGSREGSEPQVPCPGPFPSSLLFRTESSK